MALLVGLIVKLVWSDQAKLVTIDTVTEQVNIYDAKTNLSKLIERVEAGEEIVIARSGRPVAHLVPVPRRPNRSPGSLRGAITIAPDFDAPDEQLADLMENGAIFPDPQSPR